MFRSCSHHLYLYYYPFTLFFKNGNIYLDPIPYPVPILTISYIIKKGEDFSISVLYFVDKYNEYID